MNANLEELAAEAVKRALALGATDAECTASEGAEFSVSVRKGEVEKLKEAGSKAIGLRVLLGKKQGSAYTSDLSKEGLEQMVRAAVDLAGITSEDPFAGLPDASELGKLEGDLGLFYEETALLPATVVSKRIGAFCVSTFRAPSRRNALAAAFWPTNSGDSSFEN